MLENIWSWVGFGQAWSDEDVEQFMDWSEGISGLRIE
jgi:hypothetical protein